ncbi:hypothetical protein NQ317_009287 [Molorchus minor]|uniref:Uncharacterized protein n=1 Tax=Molorchus minor TaxID=1323400 RepID=A0ABQ9JBP4_9CUCU|nr:hypothetical protein NQ317_009287 [Molorchus minor]
MKDAQLIANSLIIDYCSTLDRSNVTKRNSNSVPNEDLAYLEKFYVNQHEKQKKGKTDFGTDRGYSGTQEHNIRMNKYLLEYEE